MKALIAEYSMYHDPNLAPEGRAMFMSLSASFSRCGYEVVTPGQGDFYLEIEKLAPGCDVGLVIAPDHLLPRFTLAMESSTHNLGCGSMNVAVCANKMRTGAILASHGIAVPEEQEEGLRVVKPVSGCGASGVRLTRSPAGQGEFGQRFIEGENFSVSVVGSRVVGEACLYFTGEPPVALALNRQHIEIDPEGQFHYRGGETPASHPKEQEIKDTAINAVKTLGCQGYAGVDVVVADRVYVVDVNPRITTSIVGITACMDEEIADILTRASKGEAIGGLHFAGHACFDASGAITGRYSGDNSS
ncbi:MAG: ATP-grasp domain-containing protein [Methanomicrobiales archaeon]|nr:ATP-grasp domain-containing protein [Methanomicrobiales archaeon]